MRQSSAVSTAVVAFLASSTTVLAWPEYTPMIPNGGNVPDYPNIGHINEDGEGGENAFGEDFAVYGDDWTMEYCMADSDGDGQTNGQELGDPCCEFNMNTNPVVRWTEGISHPSDASLMSDPSLWADIDCSMSSGSAATASSGNSTTADETKEESTTETTAASGATTESGAATASSTASSQATSTSSGSSAKTPSTASSSGMASSAPSATTSGASSQSVALFAGVASLAAMFATAW